MSEGFYSGLEENLMEFLNNWRLSSEEHYVIAEATVDPCQNPKIGMSINFTLIQCFTHRHIWLLRRLTKLYHSDVGKYLEIFQLYVMIYLATFRREIDLAVSWVQNAEIPEGKRQVRGMHCSFCLNVPAISYVIFILIHFWGLLGTSFQFGLFIIMNHMLGLYVSTCPKKRVICVSFRGQLLISFNEWLHFKKGKKEKKMLETWFDCWS